MLKGANISKNKRFRYSLWRIWDGKLPCIMFLMLNPSTADADTDDATIRKIMKYAKAWGYGGIYVCNLFAYRTKDPKELKAVYKSNWQNPYKVIGKHNDREILKCYLKCDDIIFAWGRNGSLLNRDQKVMNMFKGGNYLRLTQNGMPCHPLYLPDNLVPKPLVINNVN